ncbi:MAG: DegT/DnrJ/EryC1/StrS family aminotransferase [Hyphomonadaceae bacterium]|nr:DegT/DnrJ/EryC1/StrS family aminotransferase [Hyphomonadaceae bacterium]
MIPVCEPLLTGNESRYVEDCIKSGWVSSEGKYITAFEEKWAAYCGAKFGVACSNGTTALQMAVSALDLPAGSEIIMPSFTIISCALAVVETGCVPVLVDCEPDTWNLDLDAVEAKITPRTRAIMPVHMFGHPVDMPRLMQIAKRHDLKVIEDAAEAHGAEVGGRKVGGFGDLACFSFYANKIITTGEGGMVLTSDPDLAARLKSLRNLCFRPERRFYHTELGHNYRLTNVQAAVGLAQLERIEEHVEKKRWMARAYRERLHDLHQLALPVERQGVKNVYWMYGLVLSDDVPFDAVEFAARLQALGVQTRPLFLGMHEQPVFHERGLHVGERHAVTERLARRGLYVPSGLTLTIQQIDAVSEAVRASLQ